MKLDATPIFGIAPQRLLAAHDRARQRLLRERTEAGHWVGELATSALSTATAVSALAMMRKSGAAECPGSAESLVSRGIQWLAEHQNADGGWGDTETSYSNVATTMLAVAALHLADVTDHHSLLLGRADQYLSRVGRIEALRARYGRDKTFAVPILTNCALAGLVPWREVSPLPFELACLPQGLYRFLRLPVVSYAIPALVAIGQARHGHRPSANPLVRYWRSRSVEPSLAVLEKIQPASGGYLEAVPLTSFVVMSLASMGRGSHEVTQRGAEFLVNSVRPDGSWPIDTNLATWNTSLSLNALASSEEDLAHQRCLDWLLGCQQQRIHPYTGAAAGGWGWSDLSGSVPDADDTPGALLALATWSRSPNCRGQDRRRIRDAAASGIRWLVELQNRDGGWPTFCRGWGKLPFDRSGPDLTAHAIRALHAWSDLVDSRRAIRRGLAYLTRSQQRDGSWIPLWFGNQDHPREENPVYGTARVVLAYRDLEMLDHPSCVNALQWLVAARNADGGWGGGPSLAARWKSQWTSSVEETSLATEALLGATDLDESSVPGVTESIGAGLNWLVEAVERDRFDQPSPIGFYFAKLWYHERLYPIIFIVSALGQALRQIPAWSEIHARRSHLLTDSTESQPDPPFVPA